VDQQPLVYQVAVGACPPFYEACIASVARYCARHGFEHRVQREPVLRIAPLRSARSANALRLGYLPIYEKEAAFAYLDRPVAILDADVFAREGAPSIFEGVEGFAAVLEREMPLTPKYRDKIRKYSEGHYRPLTDVDWYWNEDGAAFYNMGVTVWMPSVRDYLRGETPAEFLRRPEFERFVNGEGAWRWSTDQTLLNWWVRSSGMPTRNLDWRWNALYGAVPDVKAAHFVHFFLAANMPERGAEIPRLLRTL
jgi:hypothetical protein